MLCPARHLAFGVVSRLALLRHRCDHGLSATHADLHFGLADSDLRVRRLGLDIDPGWLPWFGRVVGFHYGAGGP